VQADAGHRCAREAACVKVVWVCGSIVVSGRQRQQGSCSTGCRDRAWNGVRGENSEMPQGGRLLKGEGQCWCVRARLRRRVGCVYAVLLIAAGIP
jgi:hypothetical protein